MQCLYDRVYHVSLPCNACESKSTGTRPTATVTGTHVGAFHTLVRHKGCERLVEPCLTEGTLLDSAGHTVPSVETLADATCAIAARTVTGTCVGTMCSTEGRTGEEKKVAAITTIAGSTIAVTAGSAILQLTVLYQRVAITLARHTVAESLIAALHQFALAPRANEGDVSGGREVRVEVSAVHDVQRWYVADRGGHGDDGGD